MPRKESKKIVIADGFRQDRRIVLLVGKKSQQLNLQAKPAVDNSTQRVKAKPKMPYFDYLSLQSKVSKLGCLLAKAIQGVWLALKGGAT